MVSGATDLPPGGGHGPLTRIVPGRTFETCTASDTTSTGMRDSRRSLAFDGEGLPVVET